MNDLEEIGGLMKELQAAIAQAQLENPGGALSDQLGELSRELTSAFVTVQQEYPKALATVDEQIAATQREAEATLQQIDAKRQELGERLAEAAAAEAAAPLSAPDPQIDPDLGGAMRDEILSHFAPRPSTTGDTASSLWSAMRHKP